MNYHEAAVQVLEKIGGKETLISGAHCATRLPLVVKDEKRQGRIYRTGTVADHFRHRRCQSGL